MGRTLLVAVFGLSLSACLMHREYDQALDTPLTVAKEDLLITGGEDRTMFEQQTFLIEGPLAHERQLYAVRYMGLNDNADPVLRVLTHDRGRTDVPVELAETDRVDLSGYGTPPITVVVVQASDASLTYRLMSEGPFRTTVR
ncbi:MAG: hypothetical protein QGF53_05480 [Alphaproteobacteria bacterium]|jgi:hypothetical protein|nr:hypothetical protein [Alphaproteobacteria bacterium]